MALLVNFIGAGLVGQTIGHLLVKTRIANIGAICNLSQKSSLQAINFIGGGQYCSSVSELPAADITFITTPDDFIVTISEQLSKNRFLQEGSAIFHCSGSLTSDALTALKEKNCHIASIHPMQSFANPALSITQFKGTYCAIEGDDEALILARTLLNAIGAITYKINKEKKSLYHAAGVFASNYVITLFEQALLCMNEAGVENESATHIMIVLMKSAVLNLEKTLSTKKALTGPIKRGDLNTIQTHLNAFPTDIQKELYKMLGAASLPLTSHDDDTLKKLQKILIEEKTQYN